MSATHSIRPLLAAFALAAMLVPQSSQALFYAAARAVRSADAKLEEGLQAEFEGRRKEALDAFDAALNAYSEIRQKHPDVQPNHVAEQVAVCRARMLALFSDAEAEDEAVGEAVSATLATIPGDPVDSDALPRNQVHRLPGDERRTAGDERQATSDKPLDSRHSTLDTQPPPSGASLEERVSYYLHHNRAAEAVVELDTIVGASPEQAPVFQRLLLGRALVASGNYARAISILDPLAAERPGDPAVLTLAAGAHLAHGNAFSALQHLDALVAAHPQYADAYIDLAYTRFAMDPDANRDEAVLYYKHALSFGAARDRKLEAELELKVEP